jgi:putative sterol carrier protein
MLDDRVFKLSQLVAAGFARWVAGSPPERLERVMGGPLRRVLLNGIFRAMPAQFRGGEADDLEAVVHWKIRGRRDGGVDHYEVVIAGGRCRTARRPKLEPALTMEIDAVPFLRLSAGAVQGPELFMTGKLRMSGDVRVAMRVEKLFEVPRVGGI